MIAIANNIEPTTIRIREIAIIINPEIRTIISREIRTKRGRRSYNPLKYPCPSKYLCPLFLEKDENEKDQDRRWTTIVGTRRIMMENFGTLFLGCLNWTITQLSPRVPLPIRRRCEDSWLPMCPSRLGSLKTTSEIWSQDSWLKIIWRMKWTAVQWSTWRSTKQIEA